MSVASRRPKPLSCPRIWPPVERRHKLWKLRVTLKYGRTIPPWQSPWLPKTRRYPLRREIKTEEMREAEREYYE